MVHICAHTHNIQILYMLENGHPGLTLNPKPLKLNDGSELGPRSPFVGGVHVENRKTLQKPPAREAPCLSINKDTSCIWILNMTEGIFLTPPNCKVQMGYFLIQGHCALWVVASAQLTR